MDDIDLLNKALNHAVNDGVITDSEADHLEQRFVTLLTLEGDDE